MFIDKSACEFIGEDLLRCTVTRRYCRCDNAANCEIRRKESGSSACQIEVPDGTKD